MLALLQIIVGFALVFGLFWLMDRWACRQQARRARVQGLRSTKQSAGAGLSVMSFRSAS